jgi:hypothetical protein
LDAFGRDSELESPVATTAAAAITTATATVTTTTIATAAATIVTAATAAATVIATTTTTAVAATTIATATAATVITTPGSTASAAPVLFVGFFNGHFLTADGSVVQGFDSLAGFCVIGHIYEAEAFAFSGFPIHNNLSKIHCAVQFEHFFQVHIVKIVRKTCYKKLHAIDLRGKITKIKIIYSKLCYN